MRDTAAEPLADFRRVNVKARGSWPARHRRRRAQIRLCQLDQGQRRVHCAGPTVPRRRHAAAGGPIRHQQARSRTGLRELAATAGMELVVIRPPLVYGPGVRANFRSMMTWLQRGIPLPLGAIDNRRSLVALDNLCDLIATCVQHPAAAGRTFLAGDGEDVSTTELLQRLGRALGHPARLLPVPPELPRTTLGLLGKGDIAQRLCSSLQVDISPDASYWDGSPRSALTKGCSGGGHLPRLAGTLTGRAPNRGLVRIDSLLHNSSLMLISLTLAGLAVSWWLTACMRRYALSAQLIDHPNARGSHSVPTPRGGGVAIVISFAALVAALGAIGVLPLPMVAGLLVSGLLVALVGFLDDRAALPARWRFLAHVVASIWSLWLMHGIPPVPIFGFAVDLGWFGLALAATYLVWMTNLYNFMDGIDGIASIEAITVSLGGALCWWLATGTPLWFLPVVFAACVAGFLVWNYPPAKIFMGDVGSGFIGMMLGHLLAVDRAASHPSVLVLVHPDRLFHGRRNDDAGAPRSPRREIPRGASQPCLPIRLAPPRLAQDSVAGCRRDQHGLAATHRSHRRAAHAGRRNRRDDRLRAAGLAGIPLQGRRPRRTGGVI